MDNHSLTVSIVTYNTDLIELEKCLDSLRSDCIYKIFIIDNSSNERIAEFCKLRNNQPIKYIANKNVGYGAAHNLALRRSIADNECRYHLVLNSDLYFNPNILSVLLKRFNMPYNGCEVGLIHPKLLNIDGTPQATVRMLPSPFDLILRRFLPHNWFKKSREKYLLNDIDLSIEQNVPYVQGSFMLMTTKALEICGLFDERFFMYPEDIDLTRRIHRQFATLYYPECEVVHAHRQASYKSFRMLRIHVTNIIKYFNKWGWIFDSERRKFNKQLRDRTK